MKSIAPSRSIADSAQKLRRPSSVASNWQTCTGGADRWMRQRMMAGSGWKLMALLLCVEGRSNLRGNMIRVVVWCTSMIARLPDIYNGCEADFFLARLVY